MITNAEVVKAAFRILESERWRDFGDYLTDDFVWHGSLPHDISKANFLKLVAAAKGGFPDFTFGLKIVNEPGADTIKATIDPVGTHGGTFVLPGLTPVAPTGAVVALPRQVLLFTVKKEKVSRIEIEIASGGGLLDLLERLGVEVAADWFVHLFK